MPSGLACGIATVTCGIVWEVEGGQSSVTLPARLHPELLLELFLTICSVSLRMSQMVVEVATCVPVPVPVCCGTVGGMPCSTIGGATCTAEAGPEVGRGPLKSEA